MKMLRILLWVQGTYTLLTATWPLVHIDSFVFITGPKTDIWLVKTVGALLIPIALTLLTYLFVRTDRRPAALLGGGTALAFICIDSYYALTNVIPDIYLADGVLEIAFLITWVYLGGAGRLKEDLSKV